MPGAIATQFFEQLPQRQVVRQQQAAAPGFAAGRSSGRCRRVVLCKTQLLSGLDHLHLTLDGADFNGAFVDIQQRLPVFLAHAETRTQRAQAALDGLHPQRAAGVAGGVDQHLSSLQQQ
ncbi:hypothetical protein D3C78_976360 [compost metagenome]